MSGADFPVRPAACSGRLEQAVSGDPMDHAKTTCIFDSADSVTKNYTEIGRRLKKRHLPGAAQQNPTKRPNFPNKNNELKLLRRCGNWQANCNYTG